MPRPTRRIAADPEVGLTMTHEVSPELIAVIKKIGDGIQRTRPAIYVGAGTVFGLLLAGGLWYAASGATARKAARPKRRGR